MTIKGKRKRKIVTRSVFCLILSLSIFLSSFGISYAYTNAPEETKKFDQVVTSQMLRDWIAGCLEQEPNTIVAIWTNENPYNGEITWFVYWCNADLSFYVDYGSQNLYCNTTQGLSGKYSRNNFSGGDFMNNCTNQYPSASSPISIDGVTYYKFNGLDNGVNHSFYCSAPFKDTGGDREANLDLSDYLPPAYELEVWLSQDKEFVFVDVNFNIDAWGSLVSLWAYNDYGATPYTYGRDEYLGVHFYMTDTLHSEFKVPLAPFRSSYLGQDFTITSVSVMGWEDGHEEFVSVDWHLSELTPDEYNPPVSNYYTTYVYDSSYYTNLNRYVVSFGNLKIRLKSDNTLGNVFWDDEVTLLTPFNYSFIFLPQIDWIDGYEQVIDELCLQYDIVFTNCPDTLVDSIYGLGTAAHMRDYLDTTTRLFLYYVGNLSKLYSRLPFNSNIPSTYDSEYSCACLYTDSFYFKNLAYFFGDSNNLLLEIDERLFGEDGSFDLLFENMKKSYDNDYSYYSDMITYMSKLNYLVYELTSNDYFAKYLLHLASIDTKLSDIANALTGTNEEDFDNELHSPWLQIYRYFKTLFNRSLTKLPDFLDTTAEILDGGSEQIGIGFTLDNDYEQSLPLNSPSVSPTPIPIPTLFP